MDMLVDAASHLDDTEKIDPGDSTSGVYKFVEKVFAVISACTGL
jgi:hypothetical protein